MSWQPRALKKRAEEFNVGGSSSSSSTATDAAAVAQAAPSASTDSNFKGAADLDDLEDEEKAAPASKRPRTEDAAPPKPAGPPRDEVAEGASRLAEHIKSSAKFNKVAAMAFALLEGGRVTRANGGAFFAVLESAMDDPRRLREQPYRVAYRKLFTSAISKASLFPEAAQPTLRLWELQVLAQIDIFTDDSYQFNRAAKTIRESLTQLPCIYKALEPEGAVHLPEADRPPWVDALFDCVGAAMLHFKYPWSKTTCDMLVKALIDRRQNFSDEQQAEMQSWNAQCKGQKVQRQQEHQAARKDQTSYERKEAEWRSADISTSKNGGGGGGGLDGWCAKQS